MPDRYLREALLSSDRWNDLAVEVREFYIRLVLVVDDFGCYDGRPNVIATQAYPTREVDVKPMLDTLHAADLIVRYSNAGKPFLALTRWGNELLGKRRHPAPPVNNFQTDAPLRGKYSRPIGWRNPPNTDLVSVLLDLQMRPVVPQPREWRLVDRDCAPDRAVISPSAPDGTQGLHTSGSTGTSDHGAQGLATVTAHQMVTPEAEAVPEKKRKQTPTSEPEPSSAPQHGAQTLATATTTTGNGRITLQGGAWQGLSEAQRLRWQDMFAEQSIPDQLARAAAWLEAHPDERAVIERDSGEHAFIVRWLLREARGTGPTKAKVDA